MSHRMLVMMTQLKNKAGVSCRKHRCVKCELNLHDTCFEIFEILIMFENVSISFV